ncbi:hypothetical protein [Geobacter sp. SVR]|uniref:hypothetical protein n=1 Tax=Geobacter sp. SVR TaxID=2495594 RepID=UPI00143EF96A|nr:hypothetical protein [Geobacter sp. SVR]BCS56001.1 hypothetical protein GSVR_43090 [Geobacter sp. SVR]GCF84764.1 hypothetical protein GSbR_13640 [Geobacter sp. SVR]
MTAVTDDLEKLLAEVRSTIRDNEKFLKSLGDDSADPDDPAEEAEEEKALEEGDFEEL